MNFNPIAFIKAGKATFTVKNDATGKRFTFRVRKAGEHKPFWFVSVLTGTDNEHSYMGSMKDNMQLFPTLNSKVKPDAQAWKTFSWLMAHVTSLPSNVHIYHEGKCGRCGRTLTVPESISSGFGKECLSKVNFPLL
jgi:hypothetical protein